MTYKESHLKFILEDSVQSPAKFISIVGPTCTGKTDLSLALANQLKLPIINADSRLIYDEMNIGTAKPGQPELNSAQHYLINNRKPDQSYSAGDYRRDFDAVVKSLGLEQPLAIVVGGTGLYLRCALENLDLPEIDKDAGLRAELAELSLEQLNDKLNALDSEAHLEIDIHNKIRIIRAIELVTLSAKPLKEIRKKNLTNRYSVNYYGLNFHNRDSLYNLINMRVIKMIDNGLVEEVKILLGEHGKSQTLMGTIGYKEIIGHLEGLYNLDEAITIIQQKTRLYAKRQITWFRTNTNIKWLYHD